MRADNGLPIHTSVPDRSRILIAVGGRPRYDQMLMALFRFMVIDEDGRRVGRFESDDPGWHAGDTFALDEQTLQIVEILPEVSTMVAYNAVWVATPAADDSARDLERDGERAARL
jgi:hypothetical protein